MSHGLRYHLYLWIIKHRIRFGPFEDLVRRGLWTRADYQYVKNSEALDRDPRMHP